MNIEQHRSRIDELDREIIKLLNERAECARKIFATKLRADQSVFAPSREQQVLDNVSRANEGPLSTAAVHAIYREVISACRAVQRRLTVAFWGPPASNTHVAARRHFGGMAEYHETGSVAETFLEVERGHADLGVVPVENSTEGVVTRSLDMFLQCDLHVSAEIYVPIHHCLLSNAESIQQIKRVYTMFQATAQCREWISRNLGHVELVETTTTARGAELASKDPECGAIANSAAAEHYGVKILAEQIEDNPRNRTRFWVVGQVQAPPTGRDKTSLLFSVAHKPGALARALAAFADNGVSLTFIESRPTKQTPWEYVFFVDVVGHVAAAEDSPLRRALAALEPHCIFCRVLGSYPEAPEIPDPGQVGPSPE